MAIEEEEVKLYFPPHFPLTLALRLAYLQPNLIRKPPPITSEKKARVFVSRFNGSSGTLTVDWKTVDQTALGGSPGAEK